MCQTYLDNFFDVVDLKFQTELKNEFKKVKVRLTKQKLR